MQSHYSYVFDNITNTYNFATKNNILYRVAFIVDETFSTISGQDIPNIFQIVIDKATEETEPFDAKVSKTIEHIIDTFFTNIKNSLLYICSEDNLKAKQRHEIFNRWYKKSNHKETIVKIDNIIEIVLDNFEVQKLYTSFLFHRDNEDYELLIKIYNQVETVLNSEK